MLSNKIVQIINFSFARTLYKPYLKKYFNKREENVLKAKQQIQKKLNIPPMSNKLLINVFRKKPKIFVDKTVQNQRFENRILFLKQLSKKYQIAQVMIDVMYKNRFILFKMTQQQIEKLCKDVHQNYGFSDDQIKSIFSNYYRTINPKLTVMLDQKIKLFQDYLKLNKQNSIQLFVKHPFLIPASLQKIKQTIVLLLSQSKIVPNNVLNIQKIISLLNQFPQTFLLGRHQIKDLIKIYRSWGLTDQQLWNIVLQNPILLNNFPYQVMPLKRKLFRYFKFTKQMGKLMLKKYPLVLLSSINSLQAKLIFITDRLKLKIDQNTLELLQYKFSQIRPRGQLLARAKENMTLQIFVNSYLKISDEQFASKLGIPVQRLNEQKQRFKQTDELDFRRRKVLKGSNVQEKIKSIVTNMRKNVKFETVV